MTDKPTYESLQKRVYELEQARTDREKALQESENTCCPDPVMQIWKNRLMLWNR